MHYVQNKKTAKKSHNSDMKSIWQIENHWQASTYTSHICLNGLTNVWIEYKIFVDKKRQKWGPKLHLSCMSD